MRPLTVKVVGDGHPVPGVWVLAQEGDLRRAHGRTDAEGEARLTGLGAGPLAFEVREPERFESYEVLRWDERSAELTVRVP